MTRAYTCVSLRIWHVHINTTFINMRRLQHRLGHKNNVLIGVDGLRWVETIHEENINYIL